MASTKQDVMEKYADILNQDRPEDLRLLRRYPRMAVAERAKIFAPFAALRGHSERLAVEDNRLLRQRRIEFSEEERTHLSEKLAQIKKGMEIEVCYFSPDETSQDMGWYVRRTGKVNDIDDVFQTLKLDDRIIRFGDMADISGKEIMQTESMSME